MIEMQKQLLILASASPRRAEILTQMGIDFSIYPSRVEEHVDESWDSQKAVIELAKQKALSVSLEFLDQPILGADTVVTLDRKILGKPRDRMEARRWLTQMSGRFHEVFTGVSLFQNGKELGSDFQCTKVYFNSLLERDIDYYLESDEYLDKAGAYGIQGKACRFIREINGCYYNVVGLPIHATLRLLDLLDR